MVNAVLSRCEDRRFESCWTRSSHSVVEMGASLLLVLRWVKKEKTKRAEDHVRSKKLRPVIPCRLDELTSLGMRHDEVS